MKNEIEPCKIIFDVSTKKKEKNKKKKVENEEKMCCYRLNEIYDFIDV